MIAGVVLAAGVSSRLGRPKQLLEIAGEPLLRYTLRPILASRLDQVVVVIGHEAEAVRDAIADLPVEIVVNPDFAAGQSASVKAGLAALKPNAEAAMFLLGDQPGMSGDVIDALIAAWQESGAPVVAPRYADGIGNPVLFARRTFREFALLDGDTGARAIVQAHQRAGDLLATPIAQPAPRDVDTDADVTALLSSLAELPVPHVPRSRHAERGPESRAAGGRNSSPPATGP